MDEQHHLEKSQVDWRYELEEELYARYLLDNRHFFLLGTHLGSDQLGDLGSR